jgi:hypothetical protein
MRLAATIALAIGIVAGPATAREIFQIDAWEGGSFTGRDGRFAGCSVETAYWNSAILRFSIDRRSSLAMTAKHPRWQFGRNRRIPINYAFDGGPQHAASALAGSGGALRFALPQSVWKRLARASDVTVFTPRGRFQFKLGRIAAVLLRLVRCAKQEAIAERRRPYRGGRARVDPGRPRAENGRRRPDRLQRAAVRPVNPGLLRAAGRTVRKALDRAGLSHFKMMSRREQGSAYRTNQLAWRSPRSQVVGVMRIFPSRARRAHTLVTTRVIALARRLCRGRFGTGIKSVGDRDNPVSVRFFTYCDAPGGRRIHFTLFPVRGGYYVVSHSSRRSNEAYLTRVDDAVYTQLRRMLPRRR